MAVLTSIALIDPLSAARIEDIARCLLPMQLDRRQVRSDGACVDCTLANACRGLKELVIAQTGQRQGQMRSNPSDLSWPKVRNRRDKMKRYKIRCLAAGSLIALGTATSSFAAECIAPANPGGGWDFTCRTIGKIMYDIGVVDKPVQVTNMAGGGGGLAFSHVVNERNDDAELIVAASSATATRLAQNAYAGMTADQVRFLGAIGADPGVIAVAADSPHMTFRDLLDDVCDDPAAITFAGGSAGGGFDHLKVLMALGRLNPSEDLCVPVQSVKYIGLDGGGDALTQTIGGFTQAMTGDMSEVVGFLKAGDIRVLAVFTNERVPGFEDIPTAKEQGIDLVAVNWRGLYVPKGISDDDYMRWSDALGQVGESEEWAEAMAANGLAPFNLVGPEFAGWLDGLIAEIDQLSRDIGVIQ